MWKNANQAKALVESVGDEHLRSVVVFAFERLYFVDKSPDSDFDVLHYLHVMHSLVRNRDEFIARFEFFRNGGDSASLAMPGSNSVIINCEEAQRYLSTVSDSLQRQLMSHALNALLQNEREFDGRFDALYFCRVVEHFFFDPVGLLGFVKGENSSGPFPGL